MSLPARSARSTRRLLLLVATGLLSAVLAGSATAWAAGASASNRLSLAAEETTTTSTEATSGTVVFPAPPPVTPEQGAQTGQTAVVAPAADQVVLNPGWTTDQFDVRVLPEYDEPAVLVILRFSLPADVQLPATLKLAIPTGAWLAGVGEIDSNGQFKYNYADSYPEVEPGAVWDVATIEVKDYRQLQVDYYYDPGLPGGGGKRSFPLPVQVPMDTATLILHVQQPAGATDFVVEPAPQGLGAAGDGFTYAVASYSDVRAGSTLGHLISYNNPSGGLSVEAAGPGSTGSSPGKVSTNTVLLAAILVAVVCIGAVIVYLSFSSSRKAGRTKGGGAQRSRGATPTPAASKGQRPGGKGSKATPPSHGASKAGAKTKTREAVDASTEREGETAECVACGEELDAKSRFCPNCGEARP